MKIDADIVERLDDNLISGIADAIYCKLVGADFDIIGHDLRLRLALEQRLTGSGAVPFGLDRLTTNDTAAYLGLQAETLRSTAKRKLLDEASLTHGWSGRGVSRMPCLSKGSAAARLPLITLKSDAYDGRA
jgi:hypothetical protein